MTAFTTRPEILGTFGVVASTHWIASAVGMSMLEKGGNAFDAAVAAGFVLQVVEPHLVGPGGDMPAIIYSEKHGKVEVICAQGPAPAGATIEHYRARRPETDPRRRPARHRHTGIVRRLDADAARLRPAERSRCARARHLLRRAWPSGAAARGRHHRRIGGLLREGMADVL